MAREVQTEGFPRGSGRGRDATAWSIDEARFPGRQGRLLFAYLVAEQGRPVPRDELAEALWGEAPPATWEKALSVIASKLRGLLADAGVDGANVLTSAFGCYRLDLPEGKLGRRHRGGERGARGRGSARRRRPRDRRRPRPRWPRRSLRQPFLPGEDGRVGRGEAARTRRRPWPCAERSGRGLPALGRCAGGGEVGRADDRARAVPRDGLPASDGGARRRPATAPRRCACTSSADGSSPRSSAPTRRPRPSRSTAALLEGAARPRQRPEPTPDEERPPRDARRSAAQGRPSAGGGSASPSSARRARPPSSQRPSRLAHARRVQARRPRSLRRLGRDLPPRRAAGPSGQIPVGPSPSALTAGSGSIWVANVDAHSVSRVDPAKQVVIQTIQVGNGPAGIAFGGGFVWVANSLDGTVSRIDPRTDTVVQRIPVGNGPAGVAVDSRYVWVANSSDGTVTQDRPRRRGSRWRRSRSARAPTASRSAAARSG